MEVDSNPPKIVDKVNIVRLTAYINWETRADLIKKVLPSSITIVGAKILVRHPRIASAASLHKNLQLQKQLTPMFKKSMTSM